MNEEYSTYKRKSIGATEAVITINIVLFLFCGMFKGLKELGMLWIGNPEDFNFAVQYTVNNGAYWQLVTSMFLHGSFAHIFFNMYTLYLFGKPIEERWGKLSFLSYYLATGILANIASVFFYTFVTKHPAALLGASGAVYAVILAFAGYYPNITLLLFFVIPIKTKWAIALLAGLGIFFQVTESAAGIAHITHLFGFVFGYLYLLIFFRMNAVKEMFFNKKDYFTYK